MAISILFSSLKMRDFSNIFYSARLFDIYSVRNQHWFEKWLGADLAPGHFSKQC